MSKYDVFKKQDEEMLKGIERLTCLAEMYRMDCEGNVIKKIIKTAEKQVKRGR